VKTSDAASIRNIEEGLHSKVMLAVTALLCIRFIMAYLAVSFVLYMIKRPLPFNCAYAQKRMITRIIHYRKFALFPCGSKQGGCK
jgi:hypothetical protein